MKNWPRSFNIYFLLLLLSLTLGCAVERLVSSGGHGKKEQSTIRLYLEGQHSDPNGSANVLVTRQKLRYTIERDPFLTEADLSKAMLVDDPSGDGTFAIELAFNDHGTLLLDMMTSANRGRHIIIFSQFPPAGYKTPKEHKKKDSDDDLMEVPVPKAEPPPSDTHTNAPRQSAWLTAVLIRERYTSGIFRFTPDATKEESLRIVRGLHNVIAAAKKDDQL
jgi:hypothetical protein